MATVNADMKVGNLSETITVAGETPIVDVQSAKRVRTFDTELIQSLPVAKGYASVMLLIPSMVQSGGGIPNVQLSPGMVVFGGQGGRGNEGRVQVDGLATDSGNRWQRGIWLPAGHRETAKSWQTGGLGETGRRTDDAWCQTGGNVHRALLRQRTGGSMQATTSATADRLWAAARTRNYLYDTAHRRRPVIGTGSGSSTVYRGENDISMFYNLNATSPSGDLPAVEMAGAEFQRQCRPLGPTRV